MACTPGHEYSTLPGGDRWKLTAFEDEKDRLDTCALAYLNVTILNLAGDTLHSAIRKPYEIGTDPLWGVLKQHHRGDRIEYISINNDFLRVNNSNIDTLIYHIAIQKLRSEAQLQNARLQELTFLDSLFRSDSVQHYYREIGGVYFRSFGISDTTAVRPGREVVLTYHGRFPDGRIFDDSQRMNRPLTFVYGNEHQVLKGIEIALGAMHKGERARVIIPSWLAFGSRGSAAGHVSPYAPVVYDLWVKDIGK